MQSRLRAATIAAIAWLRTRSNQRPNEPEHIGQGGEGEKTSAEHGNKPAADMLRSEWAAFQATIREIHRSEENHQAAEREIWAAQDRTAKRLNWITGIGACISVFGLIFVGLSVLIAKQAADDGAVAARAATHQAEIMADQEVRQLRAYLFVEPEKLPDGNTVSYNTSTAEIVIGLKIGNEGQTPAGNLKYVFGIDIRPTPLPFHFILNYPSDSEVANSPDGGFVTKGSPNHVQLTSTVRKISVEEWNEVADFKKGLYVFGLVMYRDVFKNSWRHTWVCMIWTGKAENRMRRCEGGIDFD